MMNLQEPPQSQLQIPEVLPLLPVRDVVVFPYMILPLFVGRESSIKAVEDALQSKDRLIFLSSQREVTEENPGPEDIFKIGTVAMIMRMRKLPDGRIKILAQGLSKAQIKEFSQTTPYYSVKLEVLQDKAITAKGLEVEALVRNIKEQLEKIVGAGRALAPDILMVIDDIRDPGRLADLIASNLGLKVDEAQQILETLDVIERLSKVYDLLSKEIEVIAMQEKIKSQAKDEMTRSQREYFLREQIRTIKHELGEQDGKQDEIDELRDKIEAANMPEETKKEALKQLTRLDRMHPDATEASIIRTYLDWMIEVPWSKQTTDNYDLNRAKEILDQDHYDLEKVKERILEFLAVRQLKNKMKGPILCFCGPPGVGKTSLGRSIAHAMGRKFTRISLGGVRDEAEIRGHRRTYVGALPGRIIQGLKQVGVNNPVFMLDEIDKLGADFRGDPSSALLEVLDPEQNHSFRDHYLNLEFDLSNVMFIATANLIDPIPSALKDRMEIIRLAGYPEQDKLKIAKRYLVPKQVEENGLTADKIEFTDTAIRQIIEEYTRESGLRNLEREIASICRKVARKFTTEGVNKVVVDKDVEEYLGPQKFLREEEQERDEVGIATGLAWTQYGGEILYVEATKMRGKGGLTLTGQLGEIMKESAQAALSYARSNARKLGIDEGMFAKYDIHVHVPAGAIPKDGPSAGVTMAAAIISLLTDHPTRKDVAMTGEITLRGKVLPIGGVKEKCLAAARQNIKTIIIPFRNQKDIPEIPKEVRDQLTFVLSKTVDDVLAAALLPKIVVEGVEDLGLKREKKQQEEAKKRTSIPRAA
ncbi:MAG: endopeptidase La [Deltaproteobacteria bacterium RIFCSPHIGHO2_12_FULL_43_9]|nr:MAG: endopeptidase La [Deltaproteobacteria bacterium RIFCSPHIGHO2_12_FULL_43_9]